MLARMMMGLADEHFAEKIVRIDATYLKAHRTAIGMVFKKRRGLLIGHTNGDTDTTLHANCNSQAQPLNLFMIAGQVNDYIGAQALLHGLPTVDWFREASRARGAAVAVIRYTK